MLIDTGFTSSEEVIEKLTKTIGFLVKEVTGLKVVEADETIPKVDGPYILIDLSALDQYDWKTDEMMDEEGNSHAIHNYTATYTLTGYRGKPYWALARVCQSFGLNFLYDKYFPTGSPFAYSSSSTIARMRVPLNAQLYEDRARVQIIFNVSFIERDFGSFEDVEQINVSIGTTYVEDEINSTATIRVPGQGITTTPNTTSVTSVVV